MALSEQEVAALQENVRRARLNRKVKILSPFWAKKLEEKKIAAKNAKKKEKDTVKKRRSCSGFA